MKNIKKITKAVAGSALLLGATLAGATTMTAAQNNQNQTNTTGDLGEYPQPFLDNDGTVDTSIVVGESARTIDVVGAVEIAGSLGAAASPGIARTVSEFSWTAENGATLSTRNDQLRFLNQLDTVRSTLTEDDLSSLETTTFRDDGGETTEVENFLYPGNQQVTFGQPEDSDDDPFLYVPNPADVTSSDYLYRLQANFDDEIDFTDEDVQDEEIELFGNTYTVSEDTTASELILLGGQEEFEVESGQERTITIDGDEHTIEVTSVTSSETAAIRVDGELRERDEDQTFSVNDQEVRVRDIIQTNENEGEGVVTFTIGSQELRLQAGQEIEDDDGDSIDGSYVEMNGGTTTEADQLSSLSIYVGAEDDDQEWVEAGESYAHPAFEDFEFQFGGLNPDAQEDSAGNVDVSTSGDDTATVSFTSDGEDATLEYGYIDGDNQDVLFEDSDEGAYIMGEGADLEEDDYFTTDAGDFSHLWQVTNIDTNNDEATVDLQDQVTGQTVEVDLDLDDAETNDPYEGTEIIDGQTYSFELNNAGDTINAYWGTGASFDRPNGNNGAGTTGEVTSLYSPVDIESESALTLADEGGIIVPSSGTERQLGLPSTESTGDATFNVTATASSIDSLESTSGAVSVDTNNNTVTVSSGLTFALSASNGDVTVTPAYDDDTAITDNSVIVIEPEGEDDTESAYIVTASSDTDGEVDIQSPDYSGAGISGYTSLESDDDISAAYDVYGAYSEYNSDEQGEFALNIPAGQSVAGAGFTTSNGSLSTSSGADGNNTTAQPADWPEVATLDTAGNIDQLKQDRNMILVGGPAINELTRELAQANETMTRDEYQQGEAMIQLIEGAFTEDNDALIVAGYAGEDTLEASRFLADYSENEDRLSGQSQITLDTSGQTDTGPTVEEEDSNVTDDNQTDNETLNETENQTNNTDNQTINGSDNDSGGILPSSWP